MSEASNGGSEATGDELVDTGELPAVSGEPQPDTHGFVKAGDLLGSGLGRRQSTTWRFVLYGSAVYFLFAAWTFAGFGLPTWFALLFVLVVVVTLVVHGLIALSIRGVHKQAQLGRPHLDVPVLVRATTPNLGCKVGPDLLAEVLRLMTPDQITGAVKERILHIDRRTRVYLWGPIIGIGLIGLLVTCCLLWLTLDPPHLSNPLPAQPKPRVGRKHSTDIQPTLPGGHLPSVSLPHFSHLPIGAAMLVVLFTGFLILGVWVRWQSTVVMVTDQYLRLVTRYPDWYFLSRGEPQGAPLRKIDFSKSKVSPMAILLQLGYGLLGADTAGQADASLNGISGVRYVMDVSGLCLAHSQP